MIAITFYWVVELLGMVPERWSMSEKLTTYTYDPQEAFIAIASDGPHLTDIVVTAFIAALTGAYSTPNFSENPLFQHLGKVRREGDQWRWDDPFLEVVPAR